MVNKPGLDAFKKNCPEGMRVYECEYYAVYAHTRSCFFCKHCSDMWFDYQNGPYMYICSYPTKADMEDHSIEGMKGKCNNFEEDEINETD